MQRNLYPDTFPMHSFLSTRCLGQPCTLLPHKRAKHASDACAAQKHRMEMEMAAGTRGESRQLPKMVAGGKREKLGTPCVRRATEVLVLSGS